MRIAIIGAGNVGGAIDPGLKGKGHEGMPGARDPQGAEVALESAVEG